MTAPPGISCPVFLSSPLFMQATTRTRIQFRFGTWQYNLLASKVKSLLQSFYVFLSSFTLICLSGKIQDTDCGFNDSLGSKEIDISY